MLRVRFLGVRGSFPCSLPANRRYGANTACAVLSVEGEPPLLLDLGTGLLAGNAEWPDPFRATALVTHVHLDHIQGLAFFPPLHRVGTRLDIYGPPPGYGSLLEAFGGIIGPPYFPVPLGALEADLRFHEVLRADFEIGSATVAVRPVPHVGPTVGYRVGWGGATVAYISDHQAPPDFHHVPDDVLELCDGVDLLIHDAQYTQEEFDSKADWGHSTYDYTVRVAQASGARRLCLYHHDPSRTDDDLDGLVAVARRACAGSSLTEVTAATEDTTIEL